jgi:molybdate/tungstate transport system substrate-binding protein
MTKRLLFALVSAVLALASCTSGTGSEAHTITVFNAGALALPLRVALDSFARANQLQVRQENAGSLETARKLTELGKIPDAVALADTAIFSWLLDSLIARPIVVLGRTRMVLAYTDRSRFAAEITPDNWYRILQRPGVQVGRSDPALDPAGYRALLLFQLAERFYHVPGLAAALQRAAPPANIRSKSADLLAVLQTGNLDYAWEYESVARSVGLRFVRLPPQIDLGDQQFAATYATAQLAVPGKSRRGQDTVVIHGAPIVFGIGTPKAPPHDSVGERFVTYLLSREGQAIIANHYLEPFRAQTGDTARSSGDVQRR